MKRHYVYGLFYKDEDGNNVCFYIGSGKGDRIKKHFYKSQKGKNKYKDRKIEKLKRGEYDVKGIKLVENISGSKAKELEQRLLYKDEVWENLTNLKRAVSEYRPEDHSSLDRKEAAEIKWLADHSNFTQKQIGEKYGTTKKNVSCIKHDKSWHDIEKKRPEFYSGEKLNRTGNVNKKYSDREIGEIKWLCRNAGLTYYEIAEKYGTYKGQIGKINNEKIREQVNPQKPK